MNGNQQKMQQFAEYMAKITEKFVKTSKQMHQMSIQFLKIMAPHAQKPQKGRVKNKQKQKVEDLNSNLVDGDEQQINGISPRKKLKTHSRIEQAQEDIDDYIMTDKPAAKSGKKTEQKNQKKGQPQTDESKKKQKVISHKPKAPTSSFLLFFKQQQHSIAKSYPNYGVVQLTKVAAKCWNDLFDQQKQPYQKLFQLQRKKYQQQMQKYRRDYPQQVKQKQLQKKQKKKKRAKQRRQRQAKNPKPAKQKPITITANKDPSLYPQAGLYPHPAPAAELYPQMTPMGNSLVKLEHRAQESQEREQKPMPDLTKYEQREQQEGEQLQDLAAGSNSQEEEENSLGEDV